MSTTLTSIASPNFWFLADHDRLLLKCAAQAERLVFDDPNAALVKLRLFGEMLAKQVAVRTSIPLFKDDTALRLLQRLDEEGVLSSKSKDIFHLLRKAGNLAVHDFQGEAHHALDALRFARSLAIWFHRAFGDDEGFSAGEFLPPPKPSQAGEALSEELERLREKLARSEEAQLVAQEEANKAYEQLASVQVLLEETEVKNRVDQDDFSRRLAGLQEEAAQKSKAEIDNKKKSLAVLADETIDLDEADTRKLIDAQLVGVGWEADTSLLTYKSGTRPQKGRNLAIAEWPTSSGPADYVLFVGLTPVAVVEAKRKRKKVSGALDQSKRYSKCYVVKSEERLHEGAPWDGHYIPFLLASNGRPYLKQIEHESGVWFRDARISTNIPRALTGWPTPSGLVELLAQDIRKADDELASSSSDYIDLRYYQHEALEAVESAIAKGQRNILIAMATGTGKTRTCIGLAYRLCKAKRFRRILFLVDRTSLGEQTADSFKDFQLEAHQTFADIYDVKELGDITPDKDTRFHIATIQGLMRRLLYSTEDESVPSIDQYDCVIVDECHRGYNLDKDMGEVELTFRDERDYISKYSRVLDHFDAVRIGLTATPAIHTTDIFGPPVYSYSYRKAVIDGYLVDHEPPIRIITRLAEDNIVWKPGEDVDFIDTRSGEVDSWRLEDELEMEVDKFNKQVVTESFNRVVCEKLAEYLDPSLDEKTLIFCATDDHADMVVQILKEVFTDVHGQVDNDAIQKITGQADKPLSLIRHFKNEKQPNIVVTVDLLTTGIDVPAISNLVFLRRVRSRILYEQMLGRATRLCDDIGKEYFRIFDPVDLYSALDPVSGIKPVVTNPSVTFTQLVKELTEADCDEVRSVLVDQFCAKLQRKKRFIKDDNLERFISMTGLEPKEFVKQIAKDDTYASAERILKVSGIGRFLDEIRSNGQSKRLISYHEDEVRRTERGYGTASKPDDFLEQFGSFIENNKNEIAALKIVLQRPGELTRAQLKELKLLLDEEGFSEVKLRTAWKEKTNQEITASIIGFIRQQALGSPLISYEERVIKAKKRILESRNWTSVQKQWLRRICAQLEKEVIVDKEALDSGEFKVNGGFKRFDKLFEGKMNEVLIELNNALWGEVG